MVLTNKLFQQYNIACDKVENVDDGLLIASELLAELSNSKSGIGLAAPQIGITKRVCVINVKEPIVLINPEVIESDGEFIFKEGCLSYPTKTVKVKRHTMIAVEADNLDEPLIFDIRKDGDMNDILEIACIQHEIDHLDGVTMFDRKYVQKPYRAPKKYGRNEIVQIISDDKKECKSIKWKKAQPLINSGDWKVYTHTNNTVTQ